MSITLKFFMIKRGFTYEKLLSKSGAQTSADLLDYVRGIGVTPTENDITELSAFFESRSSNESTSTTEFSTTEEVVEQQQKSRRKKKNNV